MFTSMYWYLFICLLFFGIGDFLGVVTKAKVSAVFVSLMLFREFPAVSYSRRQEAR